MEETTVQKSASAKQVGNTNVVEEKVVTDYQPDPQEFSIAKLSQVVLYFAHFVAIILALRFIFLLLGANMRGIVLFIYSISQIFVLPFTGIFPAPSAGGSYFDSGAVLAIVIYYLLAFLIIKGITLFSKSTED